MNRNKRILLALCILVFVVALVGVFTIAQAQNVVGVQRWEYALMTWDVGNNNFVFNVSGFYSGEDSNFGLISERDTTDQLFSLLDESGIAGLVDYLAVLGLQGYELIDISSLSGGGNTVYVYHFKRPEKQ